MTIRPSKISDMPIVQRKAFAALLLLVTSLGLHTYSSVKYKRILKSLGEDQELNPISLLR